MCAVYLLVHRTEPRFKLGSSLRPQQRIVALPEFGKGELDLQASHVVWLESQSRAAQVERSMHKLLSKSSFVTAHCGDGHTEWFSSRALPHAAHLLQQVPMDRALSRFAQVLPFLSAPAEAPAPEEVDEESSDEWPHGAPHECWWRIEDLFLRLARLVPVEVECATAPLIRFVGIRQKWKPSFSPSLEAMLSGAVALAELRPTVMDSETYHFRRRGQLHSFVQWLEYAGDDLLVQFAAQNSMREWDKETDFAQHVRLLLQRLPLLCVQLREPRKTDPVPTSA